MTQGLQSSDIRLKTAYSSGRDDRLDSSDLSILGERRLSPELSHHSFQTRQNMRKFIALGAIAIALTTAACNTIAGVGRDVQAAGRAVTNSSDSARR